MSHVHGVLNHQICTDQWDHIQWLIHLCTCTHIDMFLPKYASCMHAYMTHMQGTTDFIRYMPTAHAHRIIDSLASKFWVTTMPYVHVDTQLNSFRSSYVIHLWHLGRTNIIAFHCPSWPMRRFFWSSQGLISPDPCTENRKIRISKDCTTIFFERLVFWPRYLLYITLLCFFMHVGFFFFYSIVMWCQI